MNLNPALVTFDRTSTRLRDALEKAIERRDLRLLSRLLGALEQLEAEVASPQN